MMKAVGAGTGIVSLVQPGKATGPPASARDPVAVAGGPRTPTAARAGEPQPSVTTAVARDFSEHLLEASRPLAHTRLSILYDKDAELFITRQVEKGSGEVVHQFPYEEQVARIRYFLDQMREDREARLDEVA